MFLFLHITLYLLHVRVCVYIMIVKLSLRLCIINPRRACAARVTVVGLCVRVSPSVCLFGDISLLEPSIAPQTILRIQHSIKVGKYVGFFLKLLRSRIMA